MVSVKRQTLPLLAWSLITISFIFYIVALSTKWHTARVDAQYKAVNSLNGAIIADNRIRFEAERDLMSNVWIKVQQKWHNGGSSTCELKVNSDNGLVKKVEGQYTGANSAVESVGDFCVHENFGILNSQGKIESGIAALANTLTPLVNTTRGDDGSSYAACSSSAASTNALCRYVPSDWVDASHSCSRWVALSCNPSKTSRALLSTCVALATMGFVFASMVIRQRVIVGRDSPPFKKLALYYFVVSILGYVAWGTYAAETDSISMREISNSIDSAAKQYGESNGWTVTSSHEASSALASGFILTSISSVLGTIAACILILLDLAEGKNNRATSQRPPTASTANNTVSSSANLQTPVTPRAEIRPGEVLPAIPTPDQINATGATPPAQLPPSPPKQSGRPDGDAIAEAVNSEVQEGESDAKQDESEENIPDDSAAAANSDSAEADANDVEISVAESSSVSEQGQVQVSDAEQVTPDDVQETGESDTVPEDQDADAGQEVSTEESAGDTQPQTSGKKSKKGKKNKKK